MYEPSVETGLSSIFGAFSSGGFLERIQAQRIEQASLAALFAILGNALIISDAI